MTKHIRIVSTPPGQAPEKIRKAWVGVEIPLIDEEFAGSFQVGIFGGQPQNADGYTVKGTIAIDRLRQKDVGAARWWQINVPWALTHNLVFACECCEEFDSEDISSS